MAGEGGKHGDAFPDVKIHHHTSLWNTRNELVGSKINVDAVHDGLLSHWKDWVVDSTILIEIK